MQAKSQIGKALPGRTAPVEKGRLRSFAQAIGETSAVFTSEEVAAAAGHPSLPVPPTYLFCLEMMDQERPLAWLEDLGVNLLHILHGEQRFDYRRVAVAGDTLTFASTLKHAFEKKGGALQFYVKETQVTDQHQRQVATLTTTIAVRRPA
jgi:acyl dehydratase